MLMLADTPNLSVNKEAHFLDMFLYLTERGERLDRLDKTKSDPSIKSGVHVLFSFGTGNNSDGTRRDFITSLKSPRRCVPVQQPSVE